MQLSKFLSFIAVLVLPLSAHATNWTICHYEFNTLTVNPANHKITAQLTHAKTLSGECPKVGTRLEFHPETLDYQSGLPRKKLPKVGQKRELIYRYLDGQCKDSGACRIEHFSVK